MELRWVRRLLLVAVAVGAGILVVGLLILIVVSLPPVQNYARRQAEHFLDSLLVGTISLQGIHTNLFTTATVRKATLHSPTTDDSVVAYDVRVDYFLPALLDKTVHLISIRVGRVCARQSRASDGTMVFPFLPWEVARKIGRAREPDEPEPVSEWRVHIDAMRVERIEARYHDQVLQLRAHVPRGTFRGSLPVRDSVVLQFAFPAAEVHSRWWNGRIDTLRVNTAIANSTAYIDTLDARSRGLTVQGRGRAPFSRESTWALTLHAQGELAGPALLPQWVPHLDLSGSAQATLGVTGTIDTPVLSLELKGDTLAFRDYRLDSLHVESSYGADARLRACCRIASPLARVTLRGQVALPALLRAPSMHDYTLDATIKQLRLSRLPRVALPHRALRPTTVQGRIHLSGSRPDTFPARISVRASASGGAFARERLKVRGSLHAGRWMLFADWGDNGVDGAGWLANDGAIGGTVQLRLPRPSLASRAFLGHIVSGRLDGRADLSGTLRKPRLALELSSPMVRWATVTVDTFGAQATVEDGTFRVSDAYAVAEGGVDTVFGLFGIDNVHGRARVEAVASGTLDTPRVVARVAASDLRIADNTLDTLAGRFILVSRDSLLWRTLRAKADDVAVVLDGSWAFARPFQLRTDVSAAVKRQGRWQEAGRASGWGSVSADSLRAQFETFSLALAAPATWLGLGPMRGRVNARGSLRSVARRLSGEATFQVVGPGLGEIVFPELSGTLALDDTLARARARLLLHDRRSVLNLQAFLPLLPNQAFTLDTLGERHATISLQGDSVDMAGFAGMLGERLRVDGGPATVTASMTQEGGGWRLRGRLDMAATRFGYTPLNITGAGVTLRSELGGTTRRPSLSFALETDAIRLPTQVIARSQWEGTLKGDTVSLSTGYAQFPGGGELRLTGSVPLSEVRTLLKGGDPDLEFEFNEVPLNIVEQFVPGLRVESGRLRGRGTATFKYGFFSSTGTLTLDNAAFSYEGVETPIGPFDGTVRLVGDTVYLDSLRGRLGRGGVTGGGFAVWRPGEALELHLSLAVEDAAVVLTDLVTVRLQSATLTIDSQDDGYLVRGSIALGETRVVKDFWVPDIIEMARGRGARATEQPSAFRRRIALELELDIDRELYIDMNLADAQLDGRLAIGGTLVEPRVDGRVEVVEGDIFYLDRRFEVLTGEIRFADSDGFNPSFAITAETEVVATTAGTATQVPGTETYIIRLNIAGTLQTPEVVLTSVPPLPQPDIVSVLTLGTTLGAVGGELASRIQTLAANELLGFGAQKLERLLGLEEIRFTGDIFSDETESGAQVTLTKRLSRRISVTYGAALRAFDEQELSVVYRLTRYLFVVGSANQRGESSIDLRTRFTW